MRPFYVVGWLPLKTTYLPEEGDLSLSNDPERNRFSARLGRATKVGTSLTGAALQAGASRVFGGGDDKLAGALAAALGNTKGPLMKVAQMLSTIPDFLPPEYAEELGQLQAHAPAMGWPFVKRRMRAELGSDWQEKFANFEKEAAHAASLGQVHKAETLNGETVACKLQYPDMSSAVESDVSQLRSLLGLFKRMDGSIDPSEMVGEITDRLREELDYERERKAMRLYGLMLEDKPFVTVPKPYDELSSKRLLTMEWVTGKPLRAFEDAPQEVRNGIAEMLFWTWWGPMNAYGVIHGDPHLGNYQITGEGEGINLLDFGCIRIFPASFVEGVVRLREALRADDFDGCMEAYEIWGFKGLTKELGEVLNVWANFIYGPILDDRVRPIADGIKPGEYGRKEAFQVRKMLKERGPVTIPAEFVFMDRAAIGLGAAYLRLGAELNYCRLFEDSIQGFDAARLEERQETALKTVGLSDD